MAAFVLGVALVVLQLTLFTAVLVLLAMAAAVGVIALLSRRQIGGFTGDVLGAGEQLAQTGVLLTLAGLT
jgi:adenosylcobinamide-GDP ribazoletransferase